MAEEAHHLLQEAVMAVEVKSAPAENSPQEAALSSLRRSLIWVSLSFGILNFVLPIYGKEIGASAVEIGMLFSAFSLMIVILRPLVGAGLDRYGRRWFYLLGLLLYGLAMLVFAFSRNVWTLLAARIVQGSGSAVLWLAVSAIVADTAQVDQRGSSFGSVSQVTNQGAIIGTFIGFAALSSLEIATGWSALFFFYAAACALAVYIAWRSVLETRPAAREKEKTRLSDGLRAVLRSRSLMGLMITGLVTGASAAMVAPIWMIYLQEKLNAGVDLIAWAALPGALVWAVLPTRLGKLADRFGRKPLILLSMFVAAGVSVLIPQMDSLVPLAVLWAIEAVCFAASQPSSEAMVTDLTEPEQRGRIFGIFAFIGGLGAVIGPIGGGWLYDTFSQAAPFYLNGVVMAASAGLLWLMLKEGRRV
jgi:MFS family permease